jgi:hypothetical protein
LAVPAVAATPLAYGGWCDVADSKSCDVFGCSQGLDKMLEYVTSDKWNEFFAKLKEDDDKLVTTRRLVTVTPLKSHTTYHSHPWA